METPEANSQVRLDSWNIERSSEQLLDFIARHEDALGFEEE